MNYHLHKRSKTEVDPVMVFARLKPLDERDAACIETSSDTHLVIRQPEFATLPRNVQSLRESTFEFAHIFDEDASQEDVFDIMCKPLVRNLINGKSGLIFAYGVTSSGKTFTVTGKPSNGGILPRAIDVLFNSVEGHLSKKYIFKPNRMNWFDVQSESDALIDRQSDYTQGVRNDKRNQVTKSEFNRVVDQTKVGDVDPDHTYAVFVSYVEVYNNYIYDLLDDSFEGINKNATSKGLREDAQRRVYVNGAVEIEVNSAEDAFLQLARGQRRRRNAQTLLNTESSRSHSVFTLRLVQGLNKGCGDLDHLTVSQLSLVDLAGSERQNRTNATGSRLKEAGNINTSLMALRSCMEALRDNQRKGANMQVPYRDSKLTYLFKSFFEGEGSVRMICCVNPRAEDYEESIQVMKFAAMCSEIEVPRAVAVSRPVETGKKRAAQRVFEANLKRLSGGECLMPLLCTYPSFPILEPQSVDDDTFFFTLESHLSERQTLKNKSLQQFATEQDLLDNEICALETENEDLRNRNVELENLVQSHKRHLDISEKKNRALSKKVREFESEIRDLKAQLSEKEAILSKEASSRERAIKDLKSKFRLDRENIDREMRVRIEDCDRAWQMRMAVKDARLAQIRDVVFNGDFGDIERMECLFDPPESKTPKSSSSENTALTESKQSSKQRPKSPPPNPTSSKPLKMKQRRSKSSSRWLEHKSGGTIDAGNLFKPTIKKKKTVNIPKVKDVKNKDHYLLQHQEIDSAGEIETRLYKGDMLPTATGGTAVEFTNVETLKVRSPDKVQIPAAPPLPSKLPSTVSSPMNVGIHGHPSGTTPSISSIIVNPKDRS